MELVYISALIVAVSIAVLIIYIIKTLKTATGAMNDVAETLKRFEEQIQGITNESEQVMHRTNNIVEDIQHKTESLNGLFASLQDVGNSLQSVSRSFREMSETAARQSRQQSEQVAQVMQWGNAAIDLYGKWQKRKTETERPKEVKSYTGG
ncbi:DUF948 domain-containing protein [Bacillus piscicola]|uniref:DUF948 domain-containing protein n=1 Tax=Bacillus piscicola TaxID=1632684 RepID=UPI001F08CD19|nr:DUF948 domain-containing protein [Bacillus piscicola]